ncbi:MAG: metalloregulator ArsR/SmtB family transcription factor [Actinomycetaceae bacterium]|nr:metalloregulator ArsR/SmtB family transcription factor [Actinomycetaceae bacterium]
MSYSTEDFISLVSIFKALGSEKRLEILRHLFDSPKCVHELCQEIEISQPLASQHLKVLRDANIIRAQRKGRENMYVVTDHHVRDLVIETIEYHRSKREGSS